MTTDLTTAICCVDSRQEAATSLSRLNSSASVSINLPQSIEYPWPAANAINVELTTAGCCIDSSGDIQPSQAAKSIFVHNTGQRSQQLSVCFGHEQQG